MYKIIALSFTLLLSLSIHTYATQVVSIGSGDWGNAGTWTSGVPLCGDTITITAGDVVTIGNQQDYSGCGFPMFIIMDGTLDFDTPGKKLRLPCGSGININAGGTLESTGGGGGATNKIEICGGEIWRKSDGTINGPTTFGTPLPIELLSFEAEIDNTSVKLIWKTSSEINNDFFTIERSRNGLDFETIAEVNGSGNSNTLKKYSENDDSPLEGTSYYRLKQTDFDGKFEYFKLIAVNMNIDSDGICTLHIYPNPCVGSCTIDLKDCPLSNNQVNVELFDAMGKKIVNRITPKSNEKDISFHLNTSNNLAPGVYIVKSSANGKEQSSRVLIK